MKPKNSEPKKSTNQMSGFPFIVFGAILSWWLAHHSGRPESVFNEKNETWKWRDHEINYIIAGEGPAIVLLHAIYPGASNAQWERVVPILTKHFRVYIPDLPGFGLTTRPTVSYKPALYDDFLKDILKDVGEESATVGAIGQSAPSAIETAATEPKLIDRLVLSAPTGLTRFSEKAPIGQRLFYRFLTLPIVGTLAYFGLTSKRQILQQLQSDVFADPDMATTDAVDQIYVQSHQPGAKWAPIAMLGGRLNVNMKSSYTKVNQPILLLWGEVPSNIPVFDGGPFVDMNTNATFKSFPDARLMPESEIAEKFSATILAWINKQLAA